MSRSHTKLVLGVACSLGIMLACSKTRASSPAGGDSGNAIAGDEAESTGDSLNCAKVFAPGDVGGILADPATVTTYTFRSGSCSFETAKETGSVRVYTGTDITNELTWRDVTNSRNRTKYAPLAGVGDEAYRNIRDGTELFARKGKFYCSVVLIGAKALTTTDREPMAKKMGALCSKVFASR